MAARKQPGSRSHNSVSVDVADSFVSGRKTKTVRPLGAAVKVLSMLAIAAPTIGLITIVTKMWDMMCDTRVTPWDSGVMVLILTLSTVSLFLLAQQKTGDD